MAVIDFTQLDKRVSHRNVLFWETLTAADTAHPLQVNGTRALAGAMQVTGTFGGNVTLEGSNDGINYVTLLDFQGNAISLNAAGIVEFSTSVLWLRPAPGAGVVDVDVTIVLRG